MAMRWLDGMRDTPGSFCGLELWDNTMFPAAEVGLETFASLVMLSTDAADAHAAALKDQRNRSHLKAQAGSEKARDHLGRRKSFAPLVALTSDGDGMAGIGAGPGSLGDGGSPTRSKSRWVRSTSRSGSVLGRRPTAILSGRPSSTRGVDLGEHSHIWLRVQGGLVGLLLGLGAGFALGHFVDF